jgi:hypothetical protein
VSLLLLSSDAGVVAALCRSVALVKSVEEEEEEEGELPEPRRCRLRAGDDKRAKGGRADDAMHEQAAAAASSFEAVQQQQQQRYGDEEDDEDAEMGRTVSPLISCLISFYSRKERCTTPILYILVFERIEREKGWDRWLRGGGGLA